MILPPLVFPGLTILLLATLNVLFSGYLQINFKKAVYFYEFHSFGDELHSANHLVVSDGQGVLLDLEEKCQKFQLGSVSYQPRLKLLCFYK